MTADTTRRGQDLTASSAAYNTATDAETARRGQFLQDQASQREAEAKPDELTTLGRLMDEAGMSPEQKQQALRNKVQTMTTRAEGSPPAPAEVDASTLEQITMGALSAVEGATFVPEGGKDPIVDPDFEKQINPQKTAAAKLKAAEVYQATRNVAQAQAAYLETLGLAAGTSFQPAVEGGFFSEGSPAAIVPPAGAAPAAPQMAAPPPAASRVAGQTYDTPKGPMTWTGTGWKPAPAGSDLQGGAGQDRLGGGAPAAAAPAPGPGPMRYVDGQWVRAGGAEPAQQKGQDANLRWDGKQWVPTGKGRPVAK
jgi:hypothetical protein